MVEAEVGAGETWELTRADFTLQATKMPLMDLTEADFDEVTEKFSLMILDFWGPSCGPCRGFAPIFEAAAGRHSDVLFARINTEAEENLSKQFQIFSIPTLIAAKDGTIFYARPGTLTAEKIDRLISDMRSWAPES